MTRPLKVLHVIGSLGMGGAETWLMALLHHWSTSGAVRMDFVATSGVRGIFDDEAVALGARIHYLAFGRRQLPQFVSAWRRVLRDGNYDAIHDHADYASGWHFLLGAGVLPGIRVTHVHNPWMHIEQNYAVSGARHLTAVAGKACVERLATHVCGTSADVLMRYGFRSGSTRAAVEVLHCGIDVASFNAPREPDRESVRRELGWPPDAKIVLFAGRLDRVMELHHPRNHKNAWLALHIVKAALASDPKLRLVMAGESDSLLAWRAQIARWNLSDALRIVGVRRDLPRLMRAADALLFPSRQEGLGMVAVEAQAAGLPVVASSEVPRECVVVPGLYRSVALTAPIESWSEALLAALDAPRPPLAACRAAVEASPFSLATSARRLEALYASRK